VARVIRSRAEVIASPVADAHVRGAALLAQAHAEAERVVEKARAEADRIRAEAEDAGRREGQAGLAALEARSIEARARAIDEAERTVVALVTTIAERVLGAALEDGPERIVPAVRAQLDRVRRARTLDIRVHPDDAPSVREALARGGLGEVPGAASITADATITRGGCVLSSDLGTLDARLEVQLAAFERALDASRTASARTR